MRGARLLASWAPGVTARRGAQVNGSILNELYFGAHPHQSRLGLFGVPSRQFSGISGSLRNNLSLTSGLSTRQIDGSRFDIIRSQLLAHSRFFSSSQRSLESKPVNPPAKQAQTNNATAQDKEDEEIDKGFELSEKGAQAAQVNLAAKLTKDGAGNKKAGFKEIWRLLLIARPEARKLGFAFFFLLISSSITMSVPFSIGKIMDAATKSSDEEGGGNLLFGLSVPMFYGALAGILTLGAAANYGRIVILRIVGERIVSRLRSKLFRNTFVQDAEFFDANRVGDLISRLGSDTIIVGKSITQNLSDGLRAAVSGAAGFGLMTYVSLKLSSVLLVLLPPIGLGAFFYGRAIRNLSRKIQRNLGTLTKIAEERLGNVKTSQSFAGEILEVNRYNNQVRKIFELGKRESLISATFFSSTGFMGNMTILALLYVGGGMVQSGGITIGELTSFLMYTAYAGSSMFGLSSFYSELMKGVGAASRLFELQDREPTISPTKGKKVESARGPIRFENVNFSYPTRPAVPIFKDLNFEIPQGKNVAIVGPSGGGKSTIASLLLRFYNTTEGRILIGGNDISEMNAKSLRRKIGVVAQEPVLFSGTIAENISYGRPRATRSEIIAAARKANCQFISDFPDGLDTQVGPRGAQLSGGQKQRIAIARALIKDPDILILDEATSALDAESETLVNSALAALLRGNNTTISIAHRLSTIKRSDTIIVLAPDGKVAEQGTYEELSSRPDGAFTKLMEWQISGGENTPANAPISPATEEKLWQLEKEEAEADVEDASSERDQQKK
ncbi:ATP-binding cassette permease mdl1 [Aspergillus brasiliensis]|uniref:ABC multidrug transporter MDR2 n=1 Tax=Aspergillus brasiliensis TaxID=319629 RepID=A0A9W5YX59_9EURO|nr:ATP-binding cassette permease mdl1 [Aspergillus brasiliensis]GKZ33088.1 ATP-binding cassette permease mdl1 [Aspergillus brasiliensis]GKZ51465.1 ATP-binding cassette permease mdl1 [Aspergillus brasiliensis]